MEKKIVIKDFCNGEKGDFVKCCNCEEFMIIPMGSNTCPECGEDGCFMWVSDFIGLPFLRGKEECTAEEAKELFGNNGIETEIALMANNINPDNVEVYNRIKVQDEPKKLYFVHKIATAYYAVEEMEAEYVLDKDALERGYGKQYKVRLTRKGVVGYMERGIVNGKESEFVIWDGTAFTSKEEAREYASRKGFEEL